MEAARQVVEGTAGLVMIVGEMVAKMTAVWKIELQQ
jgi:hypothetical protein